MTVLRIGLLVCSLIGCHVDGHYVFPDSITDADRATSTAPSCVGLSSTCGPTGNDSCCTSREVPAGSYHRRHDRAGDGFGDMTRPASVSAFRLDSYEVTVGRSGASVASGQGTQAMPPLVGAGMHTSIPNSGWDASWNANLAVDTASLMARLKCSAKFQTWTDTPAGNEHRPINCINWYEAMAFCAWDVGFLPTENEWNYAAAGGDLQRAYPWSRPNPGDLAIDSVHGCSNEPDLAEPPNCVGDGVTGCEVMDLVVNVGSKFDGAGRWGHSDLSRNVYEWILDYHVTTAMLPNSCADCANLSLTAYRALRGGSFESWTLFPRTALDSYDPPHERQRAYGVRCARAARGRSRRFRRLALQPAQRRGIARGTSRPFAAPARRSRCRCRRPSRTRALDGADVLRLVDCERHDLRLTRPVLAAHRPSQPAFIDDLEVTVDPSCPAS